MSFGHKRPFAVVSSDAEEKTVTSEADYWEGDKGKYVRRRFVNQWMDRKERDPFPWERQGQKIVIPGHVLSAAKNVSYYPQLLAAFAKIGCRP